MEYFFTESSVLEYMKNVDYRKERTLIICNEFEEAQQVAQYFRENNISHDLVKDGECKL